MKTSATHHGQYFNIEDERISHECRHIAKTTVLDLDAFLALDAAGRAARWQSWSLTAKAQAVTLMLIRQCGEWTDEAVQHWIGVYDAKWTPPTPVAEVPDAAVVAALEQLAEQHAGFARTARTQGLKDDATYFQRAANSYTKALIAWNDGVRPYALGRGKWLLPSRTHGPSHLVRLDGDWICSCAAAHTDHWARSLVIGIEAARETVARDLAALEGTSARAMGQRLAAARHKHQQLDNALLRTSDDVWYDRVDGYAA